MVPENQLTLFSTHELIKHKIIKHNDTMDVNNNQQTMSINGHRWNHLQDQSLQDIVSTCDDHNPWSAPLTLSVTCGDFLNHNCGNNLNLYHVHDHIHGPDRDAYHDPCSYDHNLSPGHDFLLDLYPYLVPFHGPYFALLTCILNI